MKAVQEIRGQLELQLDILSALYDIEAIAEFQREVLDATGEVSPNVTSRALEVLLLSLDRWSITTGLNYGKTPLRY